MMRRPRGSVRGGLHGLAAAAIAVVALATAMAPQASAHALVACPTVNAQTGTVTPPPAPDVDWSGCDLAGANLAGADLTNADLSGANLAGARLTGALLIGTDLHAAQLGSANLSHAALAGTDDHLDRLGADLSDANLTGANLTGAAFSFRVEVGSVAFADLSGANLSGANLTDATMSGNNVSGVNFTRANFTGAFMWFTNFAGADLSHAKMAFAGLAFANFDNGAGGADFANLTGVNFAAATLHGAKLTASNPHLSGVIWLGTVCPDGRYSDRFIGGCFGSTATTPLVLSVIGVRNGRLYVTGAVPRAGCKATDRLSPVKVPAKLLIVTSGVSGVGNFLAGCYGAADKAGHRARAASARYTVAYGFGGFRSPQAGVRISRSARSFTASFRLVRASGAPITASLAASLAAAGDVQVWLSRLAGTPFSETTCSWASSASVFRCKVPIPVWVNTGSVRYTLTATECPVKVPSLLCEFVRAPVVGTAVNPEIIQFRR